MTDKNKPTWWTPTHASAWDLMKGAMRRDWEQTKVDFGGAGKDLNQDASDTLRQASGEAPVPSSWVANAPSAGDVERRHKASEIAEHNAGVAFKRAIDAPMDSDEGRRLEAKSKAARGVANAARNDLRDVQDQRWADVENAMSFGFGAAMHRTEPWAGAEGTVKSEWLGIHPGQPWIDVKVYVQKGWDKAREGRA